MPGAVFPQAALLAELDLRGLAGQVVLTRSMGSLTLPSDVGRYRDLRHLLNGYGIWKGVPTVLNNGGTGASTWTVGLDRTTDRLTLTSSGPSAEGFTVGFNEAWGFTGATAAVLQGDGSYVATAGADWQRGMAHPGTLTVIPSTSPIFFVSTDLNVVDTMISYLRERGLGDADDQHPTNCLEVLDPLFVQDSEAVRWILDTDGLVRCAYNEGAGAPLTFPDTTAGHVFRRLLGLDTLAPSSYTENGITYQVGDRPPPSVLPLRRPLARLLPGNRRIGGGGVSLGGRTSGVNFGGSRLWMCRFEYGSPLHRYPMEQHIFAPGGFLDQVPPYYPITIQPELGDPRRAARTVGAPYTTLYTPEDAGRRGRHICKLADDLADLFASYGDDPVEFIGEIEFEATEDPDA